MEYAVTITDPTVWTAPWTVKQELTTQRDDQYRIYYEPRCHEGNYGLPALLIGARTDDKAFAEGRGPNPASQDTARVSGNYHQPSSDNQISSGGLTLSRGGEREPEHTSCEAGSRLR